MVHKPTCVTQTSSSHLDVILCSHPYNADTIPFSGSDHLLIFCDLILWAENEVGSVSHLYVKVHNFNKFDFNIFGDVDTDVWSDLDRLESLDDKVECFNIVMRAVLDMCAPLKMLRINPNSPPWLHDPAVKKARYAREHSFKNAIKLQSIEAWSKFRVARNNANKMIKKARARYLLDQTKKQPSKFWKAFNHLKSKSNSNIAPPLFTPFNFNDHFTSVAARIASSIPSSLLSPTSFISKFL